MDSKTELAYWINEREQMRLRKESADANPFWKHGWSDDPYMGLVRYCNVHRENDKVTRWLAKNWRPQYHQPWQLALARMVNYIPSLEDMQPTNMRALDDVERMLKTRRQCGEKIFTSAYTISTCGVSMDKVDYVMEVVKRVHDAPQPDFTTLASTHKSLTRIKGLGSFLAAQIVADMKNTKGHPLENAPDFWVWSAPGPGSMRGLTAYFNKQITPGTYQWAIKECYQEVKPLISQDIAPIHMQDFQNCMCEFSKYVRVKGGGHVRNTYTAW